MRPDRRAASALEARFHPPNEAGEPWGERHERERLREDGDRFDHGHHQTDASAAINAATTYTR